MQNIILNDLDQDFICFFGKPQKYFSDISKRLGIRNVWRARHFHNANNLSKEELHKLYLHEEYWASYVSCVNKTCFRDIANSQGQHEALRFAIETFNKRDDKHALDYGCLQANVGIKLASLGFQTTLMDIPHGYFRFKEYLVKKYKVPNLMFKGISLDENDIEGMYNYIYCSDVLEHCYDPEHTLRHLVSHLKDDGFIFVMPWFDDMKGADPSHLKKNTQKYNLVEQTFALYDKCGIVSITPDKDIHIAQHLFRKKK